MLLVQRKQLVYQRRIQCPDESMLVILVRDRFVVRAILVSVSHRWILYEKHNGGVGLPAGLE